MSKAGKAFRRANNQRQVTFEQTIQIQEELMQQLGQAREGLQDLAHADLAGETGRVMDAVAKACAKEGRSYGLVSMHEEIRSTLSGMSPSNTPGDQKWWEKKSGKPRESAPVSRDIPAVGEACKTVASSLAAARKAFTQVFPARGGDEDVKYARRMLSGTKGSIEAEFKARPVHPNLREPQQRAPRF